MKRMINSIVLLITMLLIGFCFLISLIPDVTLTSGATLGCYMIPAIMIIITMIIQIKKEKNIEQKEKIKNKWLKVLFVVYCLLLITILFLNNEYRTQIYRDLEIWSKEYLKEQNLIPFHTIGEYINKLANHQINTGIVILNIVTNLVLFMPMGIFASLLFEKKIKNWRQFTILLLGISVIVELIQFLTSTGLADIDDVILNALGALVSYAIMKIKKVKEFVQKILT